MAAAVQRVSSPPPIDYDTCVIGEELDPLDESSFEFIQVESSPEQQAKIHVNPNLLSFEEICQRIKPLICKILGREAGRTGFFVNETGLVVTTASRQRVDKIEYQGEVYSVVGVSIPGYNLEKIRAAGLCFLQVKASAEKKLVLKSSGLFGLPSKEWSLREGKKIYFGGFSSVGRDPHFHKTYISSISSKKQERDLTDFNIGMSADPVSVGAPVVIEEEGKLRLIGVIGESLLTRESAGIRAARLWEGVSSDSSESLQRIFAGGCKKQKSIKGSSQPQSQAGTAENELVVKA